MKQLPKVYEIQNWRKKLNVLSNYYQNLFLAVMSLRSLLCLIVCR